MKIRLTESRLKQIVAESVKNVLTELDWRTYNNASRKAMERAGTATNPYDKQRYDKMYGAFHDATQNAYTNNYDLEGFDTTPEGRNGAIIDKIKHAYDAYKSEGYSEDDIERSLKTSYGKYYDLFKKYNGNYEITNGDLRKAGRRYDDTNNYKKGNQEYKKGQGWVNKE